MNTLKRTIFSTSRLQEFFSIKELQMQIGVGRERWPLALVKELTDNALDATEAAGVAPEVTVFVENDAVGVQDNGPGLPEETLMRSLDYAVRVSDKAFYVSPTRGQLGNALKLVWTTPYVIDGGHGLVEVATGGQAYQIAVTLDRIAGEPRVEVSAEPSIIKNGTFVKIHWPEIASLLTDLERPGFYNEQRISDIGQLMCHYAMFNPHSNFVWNEGTFQRTRTDWAKWLPTDPTSPHWYTRETLRGLIAAYIHRENEEGRAYTVREFVSEFAGLSSSAKQRCVTEQAGLSGARLHDLIDGDDVDSEKLVSLLDAMCNASKPIRPERLGIIGSEHITRRLIDDHGVAVDSVRYKRISGDADGLPYMVEAALGFCSQDMEHSVRVVGLNWSPVLKTPFDELDRILEENEINSYDPVAVVVHLACPRLEFTDRGKSTLSLPFEIGYALEKAFSSVTKEFAAQKRKLKRGERLRERNLEELIKKRRRRRYSIKEAVYEVMEEAYIEASTSPRYGTLPTKARQIMYKARPRVQKLTGGRYWKTSNYFAQTLLPKFMQENPELTVNWNVVWDARGNLIEPHTEKKVPLGGIEVKNYISSWDWLQFFEKRPIPSLPGSIETSGPTHRYNFVLFIEKEGFNELFQAVRLAERYDIAIMSTKGMSVTAARRLVEEFSNRGITTLVLHDFDKSGFSILNTLRTDTWRYHFDARPLVVDLGVRLGDVDDMDLESESVEYCTNKNPSINLKHSGATEEECGFLVRRQVHRNRWIGERVELNAMGSDQLVDYVERKLAKAGVQKVVPDSEVLKKAYRQALWSRNLQKVINEAAKKLSESEENWEVPSDLSGKVKQTIEGKAISWDEAISDLADRALRRAKVPQGVRDRRRGCALRMQVRAILVGVMRSPSATDRDVQEAAALFEALGAQGFQGFIQNEVGVNSGFGG